MSAFEDARVLIFIADYAGVDAGGKINAIGAAFNVTGVQPQGGLTPPQHVVVVIEVPTSGHVRKFVGGPELRPELGCGIAEVEAACGVEGLLG